MTDAGLPFPCLALSLAVLLSLFAVPAYAASDVWDDATADGVTTDGLTVTGMSYNNRYDAKIRSVQTYSPASGGVEFEYTIENTGSSSSRSLAGLGQDPFGYSDSNNEYKSIEYAIFHNSNGRLTIYESGTNVHSSTATYTADGTDTFKITMDSDGVVKHYVNGALQYTSSTAASGNYYLHFTPNGQHALTLTDTTPPTITPPADVTAEATGALTTLDIGTATATDAVDPNPVITNDAPGSFPIGVTTVTWTATDSASNTATATQRVTVRDTTPLLTITSPPHLFQVEATGPLTAVDIGTATATSTLDTNPTVTNDAPGSFPIGMTTVTWTATDSADNTATARQYVRVRDTTPPVVTPPPDVTAEATGTLTTVDVGTPTVTDADPNPTVTHDAPGSFPPGATTVTWTATDSGGRAATATQTVTVQDTTPPTITLPADVTAEATGALTTLDIGTATATDAVDPNPVITNDAPGSFPIGVTTVTWTATDSASNTATATQRVTVQYSYSEGLRYDHTREAGDPADTITIQAHRGGDFFTLKCLFFNTDVSVWDNQSTTYYEAAHNTTDTVHVRCFEKSDEAPAFQVTSYAQYEIGSGFGVINDTLGSDGLFGVPIPFMFVLLVAAMWTGRSAQVGIIVTTATIGIMAALGLFELEPEAWALIVLLTAAGVLLGKKLF